MSGITGLGTTYNLPNYTGILYGLTPQETPFLSAIGGLSGGRQTTSPAFEWQTFDLRDASQPEVVEGATAPTSQQRVRGNVSNVVQIHQEKVSVSYSKLAATGAKAGINNDQPNPIGNELDWQVEQMLKQMARDVEFSFIGGTYQSPANNSTARKTRGIISAISTNVSDVKGAALPTVTGTASTNKIASTSHGLNNGDSVVFTALTGGAGLSTGVGYFVVNKGTNDFEVSTVKGGAAVDFTTDVSAATAYKLTAMTTAHVNEAIQRVYDNGGMDGSTTLLVNSNQKMALTSVFASAYGKFVETSRTVAGVSVDQLQTDFGILNVMLSRFVPKHQVLIAQLGQCAPVFLEVPGKGHFFAEPLAKTGSSDDVQLYGEVGLAYGNEKAHGLLSGLAL